LFWNHSESKPAVEEPEIYREEENSISNSRNQRTAVQNHFVKKLEVFGRRFPHSRYRAINHSTLYPS
jgi:hypothetical protein